ncbi:hypothetical protein [Paracoccus xiamenensis]|uniref:hypothetical protein n=1 Tax=Paracoccus xiamenensis TaxID=2714901 RepID=UPI00140CBDEA|nr:hypothetical protein [Paracoccus xiamenensis]NHF72097.1 hypothetical protein [Paracoccus xiamenensis]
MSAWLSAMNSVAGASRGRMLAEMHKAQSEMMQEWQRVWVEAWLAMWFPDMSGSRKRRK